MAKAKGKYIYIYFAHEEHSNRQEATILFTRHYDIDNSRLRPSQASPCCYFFPYYASFESLMYRKARIFHCPIRSHVFRVSLGWMCWVDLLVCDTIHLCWLLLHIYHRFLSNFFVQFSADSRSLAKSKMGEGLEGRTKVLTDEKFRALNKALKLDKKKPQGMKENLHNFVNSFHYYVREPESQRIGSIRIWKRKHGRLIHSFS